MEEKEREKFWKTLCSLPGTDVKTESEKLRRTIKYPRLLYRYRSVSLKSMEALRTNRLYFSTANYYDDPFDTFLNIDINKICGVLSEILQSPKAMDSAIDAFKQLFDGILSEEQKNQVTVESIRKALSQGLLDRFFNFTLALRNEVKKNIWSVCFSENGFNEELWLKYADQHRGFVQVYDLENDKNLLCGKQEKCIQCDIRKFGTPVYPIFYSKTPYDATDFAKRIMLQKMEGLIGKPFPSQIYEENGLDVWAYEKITLIKKKCHEYDEEWRIIARGQMKSPVMMEWIPCGIILGLRMEPAEENLVISIAKMAGIKNISKSYINSRNQLDAFPLSI